VKDISARRHRQMLWATLAGVLVAIVSIGVSVWIAHADGTNGTNVGATSPSDVAGTGDTSPTRVISPRPTDPVPAFTYLSTLPAEIGGGHLAELPRGLPGPSTYDRAVSIGCPGRGQTAEVGYALLGDYSAVSATLASVFARRTDKAVVTTFAVTQNIDGTTNKRQLAVSAVPGTGTVRITADVVGAQQLLIQVRCESADGVVVVDDGRLTRAA
jgi:hypothetical protein